jgi:hypothetical protein
MNPDSTQRGNSISPDIKYQNFTWPLHSVNLLIKNYQWDQVYNQFNNSATAFYHSLLKGPSFSGRTTCPNYFTLINFLMV